LNSPRPPYLTTDRFLTSSLLPPQIHAHILYTHTMPTVLTPQGWVKVAESPNKRRTVAAVDPADALKGPLAYFSCKRSPPKVFPGVLHLPAGVTGGGKHSTPKEAFPYDLNASPEKLRAQALERIKMGGKNRTVSAPVPEMHLDEPYQSEEEEEVMIEHRSSRHKTPSPPPSPTRSSRHHGSQSSKHSHHHHHHHHKHRSHHHDDVSSVSSGSTRSSSSSYSSSSRSHRSHERSRPTQTVPQAPLIMYTAGPPPPMPAGPRYYPAYDIPSPAHRPPPPSTGSARSMSYSWYNATTPLNL